MKFSTKEDIEAPIDEVFSILSEFEAFERSAIRRGVEVQREDEYGEPRAGMAWKTHFLLRGKPRDMRLVLAEYDRPNAMRFDAKSQGLDGVMSVDLVPLSQRRTRMAVSLELMPKTLSARLLVQSLKLAKTSLTKRFKIKVASYAKNMEDRHKRMA
ncbi:SRPBCC family protein [Arenibacterium sp. CAU 1754]